MSVLLSSLAILSVAAATPTCSNNPSFHRFSFGGIQGVVVSDGPALFDVNPFSVPNAALKRNYDASFRSSSPLVIQQNVAIVDMPAGRVLVDAGSFNIPEFPQFANAGRLLANMRAAGIAPESIQAVVFTHAHADHVAGVITADGKRAFPNAHVYIDKVDHEFWTQSNVPNPKPAIIPNATLGT
ncbi:unnamed protein product [Chondrus crispus]|uniref:Metallo-beta-lactamase domain-containing protein n=1 Tax=Chondrus crispus TaxID=2769 RepID=R7QQN0_CHOCR|nr:unnamed protein product [Chondrus crispus]CDF40033.1 unnamed protein product [Chondrus crispus]|eukprot:XP_005710327.1 unnamed protein product [Chondrus crispus]